MMESESCTVISKPNDSSALAPLQSEGRLAEPSATMCDSVESGHLSKLNSDENKLIKSSRASQVSPASGKIVKKEVYEATVTAQELVRAAERKAQDILEDARQQQQSIFDSAHQQGFEAGLSRWNQQVTEALEKQTQLERDWEQQLLHLAVGVAERIIGEQLRSDANTITSIVREALKNVGRGLHLTLHVHPQHLEPVQARLEDLRNVVGTARRIDVSPHAALKPGDCVVESELGVIDARLDTQLKCLEEALLRTVNGEDTGSPGDKRQVGEEGA